MKTILLIDDDQQVRMMFGLALTRVGYRVIEADSGVAGLAMARQHLPDLILSDIHMPGGDGSSLLREIRHDPELKSRQVVLMTGRPDLVTPRKGMEEGADDFLVKPVSLEALRNCVDARFKRMSINWRVEDDMVAELRTLVPPQLPHEVFTPLAGIVGLMELVLGDGASFGPEEIKDIHQDVYNSALRLHRTLRNYLLILDLPSAATEMPPLLPPGEVVEAIRGGIAEALRPNGKRADDLKLEVNPVSLAVRGADLTQIVEELLDNAFKFSRIGTPVSLTLSADGRIVVTDNGRGLTAEEIARIGAFRQFERKKNEQQGLGLGLVLVQKLAALCEAKLDITSQPGVSTQAIISFPPAKAVPAP